MSLGPGYNPHPTREWSRVENRPPDDFNIGNVFIPLLGIYIPQQKLPYETQMLAKGNILQYKKNSSNLTINQRYSKIAKGQWVNRTTTWATQSDSLTNPNTTSLKRVHVKRNIFLDYVGCVPTTNLPVTPCPSKPEDQHIFVPIINDCYCDPKPEIFVHEPLPLPKTGNYVQPVTYTPPTPSPIVINDGGSLIGNTTVNPCTGAVIKKTFINNCNLTSGSDVPGRIQILCYNSGLPTYYPRRRYIMTNSANKWPQGAKFLISANKIPSQ